MSLPSWPWCGVRADRRSPMRIDSRLRRAVQFRCCRRPTTNFTRPRTRSSNPVPSSRQSVSRGISPACIEKPAVAAACAGPVRRHRRQRHAGLVNFTPTGGKISVGPYSSTAAPPARFGDSDDAGPQQAGCLGTYRSRLGVESDQAHANPSTARCSCQPSGRRECASSLSAVRSAADGRRGWLR